MRLCVAVPAVCLLAAGVPRASAQLIVGTTSTITSNGAAYYIDVTALTATKLWNSAAQKKVNGLAADPVGHKLYSNDAARLNSWNYGSVGTAPTLIAGMYRTSDNVNFTATGVDGLAWASNHLYGAVSAGITNFKRGIYQISTTSDGMATPHCVATPLWVDPLSVMSFGGLEFNNDDNLFYFTNSLDNTSTGGTYTQGIYTVDAFGSGTLTKLVNFPAGHSRIDGLAIGGGKLWMTEQDPANSQINIFPFDLATQTYETPLALPFVDGTNRASGACWAPGAIPAPGTLAALALAGLGATRRRRA